MSGFPTPYEDVNAALRALLTGMREALGARLAGLYLHGSLAAGGFNPARSDIDFVAATEGELDAGARARLAALHARLHANGMRWTQKMEGSYIPLAALRRYDPAHATHPVLRVDGSFDVEHHGPDWILQRWVLREKGAALSGPDIRGLVDPVSAEELRRSTLGTLRAWWAPMLDDPFRLRSREYQAYAALTMCRARYTLAFGEVVPKDAAAAWAAGALGAEWAGLIAQALAWPDGGQPDRLAETLALIRLTLEQCGGAG